MPPAGSSDTCMIFQVAIVLNKRTGMLKSMFAAFSQLDHSDDCFDSSINYIKAQDSMSLAEFKEWAQCFQVIPTVLSSRELSLIFDECSLGGDGRGGYHEALSYTQFIEAIGRIAFSTMAGSKAQTMTQA